MSFLLPALCVLLHEAGHLSAARVMRVPFCGIGYRGTGLKLRFSGVISYRAEAVIALAGPLANLVSVGVAYLLPLPAEAKETLIAASVFYAVLNLIPFSGSDGYRCLYCLIAPVSPRMADVLCRCASDALLVVLWGISVDFLLCGGSCILLFVFVIMLFCQSRQA